MAALRKKNEQLKDENARLHAHIAALEENARLRAQTEAIADAASGCDALDRSIAGTKKARELHAYEMRVFCWLLEYSVLCTVFRARREYRLNTVYS